jgi:hypothetical protein
MFKAKKMFGNDKPKITVKEQTSYPKYDPIKCQHTGIYEGKPYFNGVLQKLNFTIHQYTYNDYSREFKDFINMYYHCLYQGDNYWSIHLR